MNIATTTREVKEIPVGLIDEPVLPSRTAMDEEKLEELAGSMRAIGQQQPIIVFRHDDRFTVVAGHRRTLAAKRAGLVVLLAIIYPTADVALDAIQFAENHFREDLSPTDEAIWFQELLDGRCGGDIERLAAHVGKKIAYIDGRLALFRGDKRVFDALAAGQISIGVAHELNTIDKPDYCFYYLDNAVRCGATISTVRAWVMEYRQLFEHQPARPAVTPAPDAGASGLVDDVNCCVICHKSDHVYAIRHRPMHTHCELAILRPLLGQQADGDNG